MTEKEIQVERRAKRILDFLAKQIGYDELRICNFFRSKDLLLDVFDGMNLHLPSYFYPKIVHAKYNIADYLENPSITAGSKIFAIKSLSYEKCLKEILMLSKVGYGISVFGYSSHQMFLKKNTSLEEILVEMDLKHI